MLVEKLKNTLRSILLAVCSLCLMSFTVVIDAGHGGDDLGAIGLVKGIKEKDLNLTVAKQLATKISQKFPEVKAIVEAVLSYGKQASAHISIYYAMYLYENRNDN